ncbi:MAG: four helix bundle protein [Limisphaerales bacterium]
MPTHFDHEELQVYRRSPSFVARVTDLLEQCPATAAVVGQLVRALTSIPLNIAEGNGRYTSANRCRFFDVARGSALECAAALDVLVAKRLLSREGLATGKQALLEIVSKLHGLIRRNSDIRLHEEPATYRVAG